MINDGNATGGVATIVNTVVQLFNAGSSNTLELQGGGLTNPVTS